MYYVLYLVFNPFETSFWKNELKIGVFIINSSASPAIFYLVFYINLC